MEIFDFLKEYWVILTAFLGWGATTWTFINHINKSTKCALRNDILDIYDRCKDKKQITRYQLQSMLYSYDLYKKRKGNSFVAEIIERVQEFEMID